MDKEALHPLLEAKIKVISASVVDKHENLPDF